MDTAAVTRRLPRRPVRPRRWAVVAVLLVMAALTAGWPLIDSVLADKEPVPSGTVLELGPGGSMAALRVTGAGWRLSKSRSDPDSSYALSRGGVDLVAGYVDLSSGASAGQLWTGLRRVLSVADEDTRLGGPRPVTSTAGATGLTGALTRENRVGTATVWVPPEQDYAVQITVLAEPGTTPGTVADAMAVARSVAFPQEAS
ncbi:hypothetical protein KQY30_01440 [Streptomyces sp. GMY02]|uniref:hypothetical protein n=1 Tax=Streptomyces sp. GMY02 TaxID=1333528 RepID=UPI001C2BBB5E|nr:hypothetical protein [Streptomyces sp. GMY02]QXE33159.1 hypothetical protein KQY30_01440 [Streptomyces sp. GMY02]